jgi:hypothetical protein
LTKNGTKLLAHCSNLPENFSYPLQRILNQPDLAESGAFSIYQ